MRRGGLGRFLISGLLLLVALYSGEALATQAARVTSMSAEVHQFPNASSPVVGTLPKDAKIRMSSDVVRDVRGEYWYKTRIPSGEVGYVRSTDVKGDQLDRDLKAAGVSGPNQAEESDPGSLPWSFVIRAMGFGGYASGAQVFEGGADGELSMTILLRAHGYLHRMFSIGPAVQYFTSNDLAVMGSLIFRIFSEGRAEPEIRLRVGDGLTSGSLLTGLNIGVRYPFSLDSDTVFCGYLEAGGLAAVSGSVAAHVFASAGLGFHF